MRWLYFAVPACSACAAPLLRINGSGRRALAILVAVVCFFGLIASVFFGLSSVETPEPWFMFLLHWGVRAVFSLFLLTAFAVVATVDGLTVFRFRRMVPGDLAEFALKHSSAEIARRYRNDWCLEQGPYRIEVIRKLPRTEAVIDVPSH